MAKELHRRLFTVDDCYKMADAGILRPDERVELIRGELIQMSPIGPRHGAAVDRATRMFVRLCGDAAIVRVQGTAVLDQFCAPEPDLILLRPRDDFYVHKNPGGSDIILILEVADSSLDYDTTVKTDLYAILGVHEYWIADLQHDRLIVHTDRQNDAYRTVREVRSGDLIAPQLLPDFRVDVSIFLP